MPKTGRLSFNRTPGTSKNSYKQNPARMSYKCRLWYFKVNLNNSATKALFDFNFINNTVKKIKTVYEVITAYTRDGSSMEGWIKFTNSVRKSFVTNIIYIADWKPVRGNSNAWCKYFQHERYQQQPRYYNRKDDDKELRTNAYEPPTKHWKAGFIGECDVE